MEIVVASGEFDLVVKRIGSRETIEDAAVCYINVGKGGEFQRVAQQFFGEPCGGKSSIAVGRKSVKIARSVFVAVLKTYIPIVAGYQSSPARALRELRCTVFCPKPTLCASPI